MTAAEIEKQIRAISERLKAINDDTPEMTGMDWARDALDGLSHAAKEKELEFAMRFNLSLLPDIIASLTAWREKAKGKQWMAWAWRVAFSVLEESEKFIAQPK